jgi:hypothetical protein
VPARVRRACAQVHASPALATAPLQPPNNQTIKQSTPPPPQVLHDFEHGGLTNDFLVSSVDPLAIVYNDK